MPLYTGGPGVPVGMTQPAQEILNELRDTILRLDKTLDRGDLRRAEELYAQLPKETTLYINTFGQTLETARHLVAEKHAAGFRRYRELSFFFIQRHKLVPLGGSSAAFHLGDMLVGLCLRAHKTCYLGFTVSPSEAYPNAPWREEVSSNFPLESLYDEDLARPRVETFFKQADLVLHAALTFNRDL